uniref:Uncharacterized protein n=1 Tax=Rhizophora mucronata TaxID=61149 RepID=A0A2P2QU03_RHIMU
MMHLIFFMLDMLRYFVSHYVYLHTSDF